MPPESVLADAGITPEMAKNATFAKAKVAPIARRKATAAVWHLRIDAGDREDSRADLQRRDLHGSKARISQGMTTLYVDGIRKAMAGVTTLEEVYRVAKKTEQDVVVA